MTDSLSKSSGRLERELVALTALKVSLGDPPGDRDRLILGALLSGDELTPEGWDIAADAMGFQDD